MQLFKHHSKEYKLIAKSKYFDKKWYLNTYPDVAAAKMDPVEHYLRHGWQERRQPCANITKLMPDFWSYSYNPLLECKPKKRPSIAKQNNCDVRFPFGTTSIEFTQETRRKNYKRLAVFASYSGDGKIHDYVVYYLKELKKVCDGIIFIADNPLYKSEVSKIKDLVIHIEAKRHKEYDFGSYKRGCIWAKQNNLLTKCQELVLCNDSVYGPFQPLAPIFNKMVRKPCDFWGMIEGFDIRRHLQSWFMVFKRPVIQSGVLEGFLLKVKQEQSFMDVVAKYELTLTEYLCNHKFICDAHILGDKHLICEQNINGNTNIAECFPGYLLKNKLCPFVKIKSLVVSKSFVADNPTEVIDYIKKTNKRMYEYIKSDLYARNLENWRLLFEQETIKDLIKKAKVISFDCFDTLLERPYVSPTDLFIHMERHYNIKGFCAERIHAEQRARTNSSKRDVSLDEIYDNILPKFQKYKRSELLFEATLLKPINKNYLLYQEAVKQHKPVVVVSNMYLSDTFIKSVLAKNGYDKITKVYVSNKCNATKSTGDLFRCVLQDFDIKPDELLHIGDNEQVDIASPNSIGIKTFLTKKTLEEHNRHYGLVKYYQFFQKNPCLETSVLLSLIIKQSLAHKLNYWQQIGYSIAAPFVLGYLKKIEASVKQNKIDTLLFVARDGYLLQKYYNILSLNPIENHYIYAPRVLNLKCFGDWCDNILYMHKYAKLLSQHIKQLDGANTDEEIKKSLEFYKDKIDAFLQQNRCNYVRYLKKQKISGKRIASVDMTTGAFSSQRFLSKMLGDKYLFGFFCASFHNKHNIYKYITFKNSVLTAHDTGVMEFLELLITAPEPPIADIDKATVVYKPLSPYDKQRIKILKDIDVGISIFIKDVYNMFITDSGTNLFNCLNFDMETIMLEIRTLCSYISAYDKYKLENVMHSGDVLNEDYVSLYQELMKYN